MNTKMLAAIGSAIDAGEATSAGKTRPRITRPRYTNPLKMTHKANGFCRTALHLLDAVKVGAHPPLIPGHEIAGRVATIGADVYTAKVGDLVGVHFEQPCGRCRQCRRQRTNLCEDGTTLGFDAPGGYAEFVVAKQTTILPLPPNSDVAFAALLDAAAPPRTERSWPSARPRKR